MNFKFEFIKKNYKKIMIMRMITIMTIIIKILIIIISTTTKIIITQISIICMIKKRKEAGQKLN